MIKGSQTITRSFPPAFEVETANKGKGNMSTDDRDECLAYRFYYYYHIHNIRFDTAVSNMQKEFFISGTTILARLTKNNALLKEIVLLTPDKKALRKLYPHLIWN